MRIIAVVFLCVFSVFGRAQVLDLEVTDYCMIDSIAPDTIVQFVRIYSINTGQTKDLTADLSAAYVPGGDVRPCGSKNRAVLDKFCFRLEEDVSLRSGITTPVSEITEITTDGGAVLPLPNYPYSVADTLQLDTDLGNYFTNNDIYIGSFQAIGSSGFGGGSSNNLIRLRYFQSEIVLNVPSFVQSVTTSEFFTAGDYTHYIDLNCNSIKTLYNGSEEVDVIPGIAERVNCDAVPCPVKNQQGQRKFTDSNTQFAAGVLNNLTIVAIDAPVFIQFDSEAPVEYPPGSWFWGADACEFLKRRIEITSTGTVHVLFML